MTKNIRLYADENFRQPLINELRKLGYDILTSREAKQDNQGISDQDVLSFATNQNRAVITYNRKDFRQLHRKGLPHYGIILCQENRYDAEYAQLIDNHLIGVEDFNNQLISIKKNQ